MIKSLEKNPLSFLLHLQPLRVQHLGLLSYAKALVDGRMKNRLPVYPAYRQMNL